MCFSPEASFAVGGALLPAGGYCLWAAAVKKPAYLGLAAVPLCFGVQQIGEGFVWLAINADPDDQTLLRPPSLFFLFFALAFWPFWFPLLTFVMEPLPKRKLICLALTLLTTAWFWVLFFPLLVEPSLLTVKTQHHSIQYLYDGLPIYRYIDKTPLRILYLLSVALPPMLGSENWGRIPGLVLGVSALFSAWMFHYAFVSVWCFFAAAMASYLCVVFYWLPWPQPATAPQLAASASSV